MKIQWSLVCVQSNGFESSLPWCCYKQWYLRVFSDSKLCREPTKVEYFLLLPWKIWTTQTSLWEYSNGWSASFSIVICKFELTSWNLILVRLTYGIKMFDVDTGILLKLNLWLRKNVVCHFTKPCSMAILWELFLPMSL